MQVLQYRDFINLASKQHNLVEEIFSQRGEIFIEDKDGNKIPVALNKIQKTLSASPKDIKNPEEVSDFLSQTLNIPKDDILKKISQKDDSYEIIAKNIDQDVADSINKKNINGLFFEEERKRIYPHDSLASQVLGFVSKDKDAEVGKYGLENIYEKELSGEKGIFEGVKDAAGSWIALGKRIIHPPKNGDNFTLTLDYNIQLKAEEILGKAVSKWQATSGDILVIDPKTGKILAMAGNPTFNPNEFSKEKNYSVFLNPLVENMYEFGSVMKPVTMAGALQENLVKPDTKYADPGTINIDGYKIQNFDQKSHGTPTMTQVLEQSLNTGAVFVANLLGHNRQLDYLKRFGFGVKTGVDLPGEIAGNISNLSAGRDVDFDTASFGQGIAVTPLQMAMAVGAIANQGNLMKPYVIDSVADESGNETQTKPEVVRSVISKDTSSTLTQMLVSVVRNGYDNRAGVKGYFVAGKTGTAQMPNKNGRGYSADVIHTFIGYAPAFDPKFLVLIQINAPKAQFASVTLPPYFKELAEFILNYYEVPPDDKAIK